MKRFLLALSFILIFTSTASFAAEEDYRQIYMNLEMPNFAYVHGIDPGQFYDNKDATYSIYPLFRLTSPLYCKNITINPGYYLLTPIEHNGKDYLLFKDNGLVKHIVPIYKKEFVPVGFYEAHLPQPKLRWRQKMTRNFYLYIGTHFKRAQKKPPVQSYLEVNDIDNNLVSIIVYYGAYRYYTLFRTVKM